MTDKTKIKNPNSRYYTKSDYSILTGATRPTIDNWLDKEFLAGSDFIRLSNNSEVIILNEKTKNKRPK